MSFLTQLLPAQRVFLPTAQRLLPGTLGWVAKRAEKDVLNGVRAGVHTGRWALGLAPLGLPLACIAGWVVWPAIDEDWKRETFSFGSAAEPAEAAAEPAAPEARVHDGPAPTGTGSWVKEGVGAMPTLAEEGSAAVNAPGSGATWTKAGVGAMPTLAGGDDADEDEDEDDE